MHSAIGITVVIVILSLFFDVLNGFHDCANAIATSVATRVLTLKQAIIMSAVLNFVGALVSEKVADTIGNGTVNISKIIPEVIIVAIISAIIWDIVTWFFGIPSSSSHALVGGLIGASLVFTKDLSVIYWKNFFFTIVIWLFLSPVIGIIAGYVFMSILNLILKPFKPVVVSKFFSKAQIVSAALMAFNHGMNDAQKSMGLITMSLVSGGIITQFHVPLWVKISCALAMATGTSLGGSRIIKTVGSKMAKLAPVNGFAAETGAALVIAIASMFKAPVSTTHIISTSIMGVAASKRMSSVRWVIAKDIVWAWVITIPVCALLSGLLIFIINLI